MSANDPYADLPDLVYSDDSSEDEMDKAKERYKRIAATWLREMSRREDRIRQGHVIKIYTLAPFLFGQVYQPDKWIKYANDAGLLPADDAIRTIDHLNLTNFKRMEYVESACDIVLKNLWDIQKLRAFLELMEKLGSVTTVDKLIRESKAEPLVLKWRKQVSPDDSESRATVAVLFAARQYCQHVVDFVEKKRDYVQDYTDMCKPQDKDMVRHKDKGNTAFQEGNYREAASSYTYGVYRSPFTHVLYGNRALAYLKLEKFVAALSDSKRCIVLKPEWYKGRYRFAEAWFGLQHFQRAIEENCTTLDKCDTGETCTSARGELEKQRERFLLRLNKDINGPKARGDGRKKHVRKMAAKPPLADKMTTPRPVVEQDGSDSDVVPGLASTSGSGGDLSTDDDWTSSESDEESTGPKETVKSVPPSLAKKVKEPQYNHKAEAQSKRLLEQRIMNQREELTRNLKEGSESLFSRKFQTAIGFYSHALQSLDAPRTYIKVVELDANEVVVIKYALGTACVETGILKDITRGMSLLEGIRTDHSEVYFPLVHLGLGRAFHTQNRFYEAVVPLSEGVTALSRIPSYSTHTWPGTKKIIEETKPGQLLVAMKALLDLCKYPPEPDAICRYQECKGHHKIQIYFSDPDFQGLVRVECYSHCVIGFHIECWKRLKSATKDKRSDKDILNGPCFTPDCPANVYTIDIYDQYGGLSKELHHHNKHNEQNEALKAKSKAKITKMKPSNPDKIARREERKQLRKSYRKQLDTETDIVSTIEQLEDATTVTSKTREEEKENQQPNHVKGGATGPPPVSSAYMTLLKKGREPGDEELYKGVKSSHKSGHKSKRKAKDKAKVTLTFNEFVGSTPADVGGSASSGQLDDRSGSPSGPAVDGMMGIDDFEDELPQYPALDARNPFSIPPSLRAEVDAFESVYTGPSSTSVPLYAPPQDDTTLNIKENIFSFFHGILKENGPLLADDVVIVRELEEFPQEAQAIVRRAGGIGTFLIESLQFAMVEDFICVMEDAVKARQLADDYRQSMGSKHHIGSRQPPPSLDNSNFPMVGETGNFGTDSPVDVSTVGVSYATHSRSVAMEAQPTTRNITLTSIATSLSVSQAQGNVDSIARPAAAQTSVSPSKPETSSVREIRETFRRQIHAAAASSAGDEEQSWDSGEALPYGGSELLANHNPALEAAFYSAGDPELPAQMAWSTEDGVVEAEELGYPPQFDVPISAALSTLATTLRGVNSVHSSPGRLPAEPEVSMSRTGSLPATPNRPLLGLSWAPPLSGMDSKLADIWNKPVGITALSEDLGPKRPPGIRASIPAVNTMRPPGMTDLLGDSRNKSEQGISPDKCPDQDVDPACSNADGLWPPNSNPHFSLAPGSHTAKPAAVAPEAVLFPATTPSGDIANASLVFPGLHDAGNLNNNKTMNNGAYPLIDSIVNRHMEEAETVVDSGNTLDGLVLKHLQEHEDSASLDSASRSGEDKGELNAVDLLVRKHLQELDSVSSNRSVSGSSVGVGGDADGVDALVKKHLQDLDNEWMHDMAASVQRNLQQHEAFQDNPCLLDNIMSDIRKDMVTSEKAPTSPVRTAGTVSSKQQGPGRPAAISTRTVGLQSVLQPAVRDAGVNTDFEDELRVRLRETEKTKEHLMDQVCELTDQYASTKRAMEKDRQSLLDAANKAQEQLKATVRSVEKREKDAAVKMQRAEYDAKVLQEELKQVKRELKEQEKETKSAKSKVSERETQLTEVRAALNTEREQRNTERQQMSSMLKTVQERFKEEEHRRDELWKAEIARANGSEVELLQLKQNVGKQVMERSLKDAELYVAQFSQYCSRFEEKGEHPPKSLLAARNEWKNTADKIREMWSQSNGAFEQQIQQVQGGEKLSNLPLLQIPQPPAPPAAPQPGMYMRGTPPPGQHGSSPNSPRAAAATTTNGPPPQDSLVAGLRQTAIAAIANQPPKPIPMPPQPQKTMASVAAANFPGPRAPPPGLSNMSNPMGYPQAPRPGNVGPRLQPHKAKNSYNKIMDALIAKFPNYKDTEIGKFIQDLRASRHGSLSGMSLQDIVDKVAERISRQQSVPQHQAASSGGWSGINPIGTGAFSRPMGLVVSRTGQATPSTSGSSTPASGATTPVSAEIFEEEEDPCIICHDDLQPATTSVLNCGHRYHTECIRCWFQQQSTCPTCRVHSLLPDDFPALS